MTQPYRELRLNRRGLTAKLIEKGSGEPVLYLHGALLSKGWNPFLEILSGNHTVFAPIQPGFEEVEGLESLHDVVDLALYYLDMLDELGLESALIVGHFLGGMVAAEMAALEPHSVAGLALVAPAGFWRKDVPVRDIFVLGDGEIREEMWYGSQSASALEAVPDQESDEERAVRIMERSIDLAAAGKFLWPIPERGLSRRIHRVRAPTLLVWGEDDRIVPIVYAEEFVSRIDRVKTVVMPACGHLPMLEQPQELAATVGEFFRGI